MRVRTISDSAARWALTLLAGLLPFFVIPVPWASADQAKILLCIVLVGIALLAWFVARLAQGFIALPASPLIFAAILLPALYLLSALVSRASVGSYVSGAGLQDTVVATVLLCSTLVLAALVFGGGARGREDFSARAVLPPLFAFLSGGAVVIIFQTVRFFFSSNLGLNGALVGSASSVVGTWHDLGILAALAVFLATALLGSRAIAGRQLRWSMAALGALSLFVLAVVGMQDVWYTLAGALLILALYRGAHARMAEGIPLGAALRRAAVPFVVGCIALAGGAEINLIYAHLPAPLQIAATEVRPSWQGTFMIGQQVLQDGGLMFGSGPNTFAEAWGEFKPMAINQTPFWSTDFQTGIGSLPTSVITLGVLGALAWLAFILALLSQVWRFVRSERRTAAREIQVAILGSALVLTAFYILYTPGAALSIMLFFLLGMSVAVSASDPKTSFIPPPLRPHSPAGSASIILCAAAGSIILFAFVHSARAVVSDMLVAKGASDYNQSGDVAHSLGLVGTALAVYPSNDRAHRAAVELGILQLRQLIGSGKQADAALLQQALARTIQEGLKAVSINSGDYQNWLTLAQLYQNLGGAGVSGAYDNALAAYRSAQSANPTNPLPVFGAAQVALAQGDATTSLLYLHKTIELKPDLAAAYYLRSQVEAGRGSWGDAIQDAKTAVGLAQQDPLGWYNLGAMFYASADYADAAQALRQAVSLSNNYANALFVLSLSFDKLGDRANAVLAMQKVVALNPAAGIATTALANLEAGRSAFATSTPSATQRRAR